jgi:hypothetical protein
MPTIAAAHQIATRLAGENAAAYLLLREQAAALLAGGHTAQAAEDILRVRG